MITRTACGLGTLLALACPAPASAEDCRLALVLALDVSSSVDRSEHQLQRQGLARALVAPEVAQAFLAGAPVALYVFEWSGLATQAPLLPGWQLVDSEDDLAAIAAAVVSRPRSGADDPHRSTAVGAALSFAARALREGPSCWARVVDVPGDGENNEGLSPALVYRHHPFEGVTVNALVVGRGPVGGELDGRGQPINEGDLVSWFHAEVLHGPGAFRIQADDYADYERAMQIKLQREVGTPLLSGWPATGLGT